MRVGLAGFLVLVVLALIGCNSPAPVPLTPTTSAPTSTASPSPTATSTPTAALVISFITPTPYPTPLPATATEVLSASPETTPTGANTPGRTTVGNTVPSGPSELGNSAADAALVQVLQSCWNVNDPRQLNGNNAAHRNAFDCARSRLLGIVQNYPAYPLVHRVLAWGFFYKDNNLQKAIAEYRTAAALYHQQGDKNGESEARMRLGLLLISGNAAQGCGELAAASNLDPSNDRAIQYYGAYACNRVSSQTSGGQPVTAPVSEPQVSLDEVRGKILFKSDRDGFDSIYVMDPDGKNQKRASTAVYKAALRFESWSPDHTQVATVRSAGYTRKFGYNNDIWITDPSGGTGRPLANPANDYDPVWSPRGLFDGKLWLAFVSNRGDIAHSQNQGDELWLMHPDGTTSLRLTCHGPVTSKHPSWSSDASHLVFYSNYPQGGTNQIFVVDLKGLGNGPDQCQVGNTLKNLSNNSFNDSEPVWVK